MNPAKRDFLRTVCYVLPLGLAGLSWADGSPPELILRVPSTSSKDNCKYARAAKRKAKAELDKALRDLKKSKADAEKAKIEHARLEATYKNMQNARKKLEAQIKTNRKADNFEIVKRLSKDLTKMHADLRKLKDKVDSAKNTVDRTKTMPKYYTQEVKSADRAYRHAVDLELRYCK